MHAAPGTTSGSVTADAVILNASGRLMSVMLIADGTNAATVTLYDNATAASGTVLAKLIVDAGLRYEWFAITHGVVCNQGIYADIDGTGAEAIVHYVRG